MIKNEPETLCVEWLSSCQCFSIIESDEKEFIFKDFRPVVGAVAVEYHNNTFSVFIGVSSQRKEDKEIAYIKSMGQRTTEQIARGIFPQFADMAYHKQNNRD